MTYTHSSATEHAGSQELLFKQRFFSWFDSYDIYDTTGRVLYEVKGRLSWGHRLEVSNASGQHVGTVQEKVLTLLPQFEFHQYGKYLGRIRKELTFLRPSFRLDYMGWHIQGDIWSWEYQVVDRIGTPIMQASKQIFRLTDTYKITVFDARNTLTCLMIVLAIDAAKCSQNQG